eukprot:CAMPEP_0178471928 /NCGR_PEP_ID=MMETSP0696-20121128/1301_1 /TAXON_ID=265572 /ORGANISM="Extubocellulus spinifer, Strain CCMP396" /LENGTH=35 /DNA_ID= /DNA_START= /DNA_END= /DNA_ORIENTATION=
MVHRKENKGNLAAQLPCFNVGIVVSRSTMLKEYAG